MSSDPVPGEPRREAHWDATYRERGPTGVSWYEPEASVSLELIRNSGVAHDAAVVDVGGGASLLVDSLLAEGFRDVSVLDVSGVALEELGRRLGPRSPVTLIHEDVLGWTPSRRYDLWHDRAVFHFLVEPSDRHRYLELLHSALQARGTVVVGTFAADGPDHCSGLPVARYGVDELVEVLGAGLEVLEQRREEHVTPAGAIQPFTWVAARLR